LELPDHEPNFFGNSQQQSRSFSGILSPRCDHFLKSSATGSIFFGNCQHLMRSFFGLFGNRIELFYENMQGQTGLRRGM